MVLSLEKSRDKFSKVAWLSACLSLLVGLSHVWSFPSYNLAVSLIALYASVQDDIDRLLKSITICATMGALTIVADIAFCLLWAREIIDGYSGVMRFCLFIFILNMFVKIALLYSAMSVAVTASSGDSSNDYDTKRSDTSSPSMHAKTPDSFHGRRAPTSSFQSVVGDHDIGIPTSPRGTPSISGLISPGYDPRISP